MVVCGCRNSCSAETFFSRKIVRDEPRRMVCCVSFLVLAGNRFWFYLLCTYVLRVQYSCGVVLVFGFWQEIVFGVTYVLSVQYSCAVVSVF